MYLLIISFSPKTKTDYIMIILIAIVVCDYRNPIKDNPDKLRQHLK